MSAARPPLSRSVEDYLKAIYGLSEQGDAASTSAIADALDVQPASVTGMVKRLAEASLLEHLPYRGVRLTASGNREALRVLRRHRIIETYLCKRLSYAWEDVHDEAESLEHAATDRLIERMAAALGFPSHDPHGAPIPTEAGQIERSDYTPLSEAEVGMRLLIRAVQDDDPERLRAAEALGLIPGARLTRSRGEGGNLSVVIHHGGGERESHSVSPDLAQHVFVLPDRGSDP